MYWFRNSNHNVKYCLTFVPCNILSPFEGPATCITNQLRGVSNISTLLPHITRSLALVSGDVLPPAEGSVTNFTDKGLYSTNTSTSSIIFLLRSLCCALMHAFLAHRFPFSPFLYNCKPILFLDVKILEVFPNPVRPSHHELAFSVGATQRGSSLQGGHYSFLSCGPSTTTSWQ